MHGLILLRCDHCGRASNARRRDLPETALRALAHFGDIDPSRAAARFLCESCFVEIRESLIDRATDIAEFLLGTAPSAEAS